MGIPHPSSVTSPPQVIVRPAMMEDVDVIKALVDQFVKTGDLLPRTKREIMISIGDWVLAEVDGKPVGIASLLVYTPTLAEVRSLAVLPETQGMGMGRKIVEATIEMARERGIPTVFALTRAVNFFLRLGFEITEKENFPQKIYQVCRICPLKDNCDETAVVMHLDNVSHEGAKARRER